MWAVVASAVAPEQWLVQSCVVLIHFSIDPLNSISSATAIGSKYFIDS